MSHLMPDRGLKNSLFIKGVVSLLMPLSTQSLKNTMKILHEMFEFHGVLLSWVND